MGYNDPKIKLETEFGNQGDLSAKGLTFDATGKLTEIAGLIFSNPNGTLAGISAVNGLKIGGAPTEVIGFYGADAVTRPVIAYTATAQSIADALVALGLCSQAAS